MYPVTPITAARAVVVTRVVSALAIVVGLSYKN